MELMNRKLLLILSFPVLLTVSLTAQPGISGRVVLDTSVWAPVAYLSHIPDLSQLRTISYQHIIGQSNLSVEGRFSFSTAHFPEGENLYRLHFSKKEDPPVSLIIGGKDHNHFFLVADNTSQIFFDAKPGKRLFDNLSAEGSALNSTLFEVLTIEEGLNALEDLPSSVNREFTRQAIYRQLREWADTCSYPLVSLYALNCSNFKEDFETNQKYYRRFFRKWKLERTVYFASFRHQLEMGPESSTTAWIIGGGSLVLLVIAIMFSRQRKNRSSEIPLSSLTVQERKVFESLKKGKTNKEIAEELLVSVSTVKSHVNNIFSKLNVNSRKEIMDLPVWGKADT